MAIPSKKAKGLEDFLRDFTGIDRRERIKANKCMLAPIGCGQEVHDKVDPDDAMAFRDEDSLREYTISGLCQKCQDDVFGA